MAEAKTKVLVTTATGTVGQWVVKYLTEAKSFEVFAAVRNTTSPFAGELAKFGANLVGVDFEDEKTLSAAVKGMDKVVFITPFVAAHQTLSELWIEAFQQHTATLKHIVRLSIYGADNPVSTLQEWHALCEVLIKNTGVNATFVRPSFFAQTIGTVYGPTMKATHSHFVPLGTAKTCYIDARDVAKALVKVVESDTEHHGQAIPLKGAAAFTQDELCQIISKAVGEEINYSSISPDLAREGMKQAGIPAIICDVVVEEMQAVTAHQDTYGVGDQSVEQFLGAPAISFEKYVNDHAFLFKPPAAAQ